jgi:selenide,water dikinase
LAASNLGPTDPNLLVGTSTFDDAGVYRLSDTLALVQTVDFFPPVVDDPYRFGQIAASNALSDLYAMNARPLTVLNLVGFPSDDEPMETLGAILAGAAERVAAAGAVTLGGHSVRDAEIKFGLAATGLADPGHLWTNTTARVGDALVLTKPLGTGFIATAAKKAPDDCPPKTLEAAILSMIELNAGARDAALRAGGVHAATDITGFGLVGHAAELADGSGVTIRIDLSALPLFPSVEALAVPRFFMRASRTNREYVEGRVMIADGADPARVELAFDAQTSGGLLFSIDPAHAEALLAALRDEGTPAAAIIGQVAPRRSSCAVSLS